MYLVLSEIFKDETRKVRSHRICGSILVQIVNKNLFLMLHSTTKKCNGCIKCDDLVKCNGCIKCDDLVIVVVGEALMIDQDGGCFICLLCVLC
jgi:hypothetical protein